VLNLKKQPTQEGEVGVLFREDAQNQNTEGRTIEEEDATTNPEVTGRSLSRKRDRKKKCD